VPVRHRIVALLGRAWLVAFLGCFLLNAAWALAAPYDGTPDEQQHIYRAAGVAGGQIAPRPEPVIDGTGGITRVPASLVRNNCWRLNRVSAACAREIGGNDTKIWVATRAARYHPGYYVAVGWPLVLWPDWTGLLVARLLSGALVAGFVAAAFACAARWSKLGAAAVLVGFTPLVASFGGALNPTAPEIAAGIALFAALIPLLRMRRYDPLFVHTFGVAAVALVSLRALGPFWLAVSVAVVAFPRFPLRELWRALRWWLGVIAVAGVLAVVWIIRQKTNELGAVGAGVNVDVLTAMRMDFFDRWENLFYEMVGKLGWMELELPALAYLAWFMMLGYLLVAGFVAGGWAHRVRTISLFVVTMGVTEVLVATSVQKLGFISQGRYMMPTLVGLPLLAVHAMTLSDDHERSLLRVAAGVLLPVHLLALCMGMARWQQGVEYPPHLDPFAGDWEPPLGTFPPVILGLCGLAALLALLWRTNRDRPGVTAVAVE
jgi:hypothetical protein